MPSSLSDVKTILARISNNVSSLDMLIEFERTLEITHTYAYKNWDMGELVDGPNIERYWVTCTFMYPKSAMPDPEGALRLQKHGCKVFYKKDVFLCPTKIKSINSYENQYTKKAILKKHDVWLVTITVPRKFIDDRINDYELEEDEVNTDDISSEYDKSMAEQPETDDFSKEEDDDII